MQSPRTLCLRSFRGPCAMRVPASAGEAQSSRRAGKQAPVKKRAHGSSCRRPWRSWWTPGRSGCRAARGRSRHRRRRRSREGRPHKCSRQTLPDRLATSRERGSEWRQRSAALRVADQGLATPGPPCMQQCMAHAKRTKTTSQRTPASAPSSRSPDPTHECARRQPIQSTRQTTHQNTRRPSAIGEGAGPAGGARGAVWRHGGRVAAVENVPMGHPEHAVPLKPQPATQTAWRGERRVRGAQ